MPDMPVEHLKIIQAVIQRMAGNSFLLKGWTVTLMVGLFAVAVKDGPAGLNPQIARLAWLPLLAFGLLDAYYLWQERSYRSLYDHVRRNPTATDFAMNPKVVAERPRAAWILTSASIWLFYGALAAVLWAAHGPPVPW